MMYSVLRSFLLAAIFDNMHFMQGLKFIIFYVDICI